MKLSNIVSSVSILLAAVSTSGAQNMVVDDDSCCHLESEITCNIGSVHGEKCETMMAFDVSKCDNPDGTDTTITAVYTMTYRNKNNAGTIKFRTDESNKKNPYSFAKANTIDANAELNQVLKADKERTYEIKRVIDPCGTPARKRFVAVLQLNGFVVARKEEFCSSRTFYSHYFELFTPTPTMSPTAAPTQKPTLNPTTTVTPAPSPNVIAAGNTINDKEGKSKGKGKHQDGWLRRERFL